MSVHDPTWSYGKSVVYNSSGTTPAPKWSYGKSSLVFEYVSAPPAGIVILRRRIEAE